MTGGLTGLSGFSAPDAIVAVPESSAADTQGGSADPRHGQATLNTIYPWQTIPVQGDYMTPYGTALQLMGTPPLAHPSGIPGQDPRADLTPDTHAAPWPTLGPADSEVRNLDHAAQVAQQSALLHASDTGAAREITYNIPEPAGNWGTIDYTTAGQTLLADGMPRQLMGSVGGVGSTDRIQGMATQNGYTFDSAHVHERISQQGVPGNFMWLRPGGRPLVIEPHGSTNNFSGQDSPFTGASTNLQQSTRSVQGAVLQTPASPYVAPPDPMLSAPVDVNQAVWSSW